MKEQPPNPGSDEALKQGCRCPVLDNCHGRGYYAGKPGEFVMIEDCPLHGAECPEPPDEEYARGS
jgi:hypothetical protein